MPEEGATYLVPEYRQWQDISEGKRGCRSLQLNERAWPIRLALSLHRLKRAELGIREMLLPARSPESSPIKNVWAMLKRARTKSRKRRPHNQREVVKVADEGRENLPWKSIYI